MNVLGATGDLPKVSQLDKPVSGEVWGDVFFLARRPVCQIRAFWSTGLIDPLRGDSCFCFS